MPPRTDATTRRAQADEMYKMSGEVLAALHQFRDLLPTIKHKAAADGGIVIHDRRNQAVAKVRDSLLLDFLKRAPDWLEALVRYVHQLEVEARDHRAEALRARPIVQALYQADVIGFDTPQAQELLRTTVKNDESQGEPTTP